MFPVDIDLSNFSDKAWIRIMNIGALSGCHQISERSFFFRKYQFPICSRCTGVLLGEFISLIQIIYVSKTSLNLYLTGLGIMYIDWLIQRVGIRSSTNFRRLITGIIGGYGLIGLYYYLYIIIKNMIFSI